MSLEKLDAIVEQLDLPGSASVLDVGCGKGEFLIRVASRWGATGLGIELSPHWVEDAQKLAETRNVSSLVTFQRMNARRYDGAGLPFDMVACLGASFIWGGYGQALDALSAWASPRGLVVIGEPFWKCEPSPEHLEAAGLQPSSYGTHWGNVSLALQKGLIFLQAFVSAEDEWDRYEGLQWQTFERYAEVNREVPGLADALETGHHYRDVYLKWGRREVGWSVYLFHKHVNDASAA